MARRYDYLRFGVVLTALAILLGFGYLQGVRADRFGQNAALQQALSLVPQAPLQVGDWVAEEIESDPEMFRKAGAEAYWTRSYRNPRHRAKFLVILMCGRSGKMAVHTPEVCYSGAGFQMTNDAQQVAVRSEIGDKALGTFWSARFSKPRGADHRLLWAWSAQSGWRASDLPRWDFRGEPFLYKLYVSHEVYSATGGDPAVDFLRDLLPELNQTLTLGGES